MDSDFKIISTLGPGSRTASFMNICRETHQSHFRLNGSHLNPKQIREYAEFLRGHSTREETHIYLDLQGSKLRIGQIDGGHRQLSAGAKIVAKATDRSPGDYIPIPHPEIFNTVLPGDILVFQDGAVKMRLEKVGKTAMHLQIIAGNHLRSGCGIHIQDKPLFPGSLPTKQKQQIAVAAQNDFSHLALSYVRSPEEIHQLRDYCQTLGYTPGLVAKIEHPDALPHLEAISEAADVVWFCRGDLGALTPLARLGYWQDVSIDVARRKNIPIYIAGQVFHHLTAHPQPTRSEVVHFYHLRQQGVSGIVLSDETAIGQNPGQAVQIITSMLNNDV